MTDPDPQDPGLFAATIKAMAATASADLRKHADLQLLGGFGGWAIVSANAADAIETLAQAWSDAQGERDELQRLFDMQQARMVAANALWRAEKPDERANVMPDLGELLAWLMSERDEARGLLAEMLDNYYDDKWLPNAFLEKAHKQLSDKPFKAPRDNERAAKP